MSASNTNQCTFSAVFCTFSGHRHKVWICFLDTDTKYESVSCTTKRSSAAQTSPRPWEFCHEALLSRLSSGQSFWTISPMLSTASLETARCTRETRGWMPQADHANWELFPTLSKSITNNPLAVCCICMLSELFMQIKLDGDGLSLKAYKGDLSGNGASNLLSESGFNLVVELSFVSRRQHRHNYALAINRPHWETFFCNVTSPSFHMTNKCQKQQTVLLVYISNICSRVLAQMCS